MSKAVAFIASIRDFEMATDIYKQCRRYFKFPNEGEKTQDFVRMVIESNNIHFALATLDHKVIGYCMFCDSVSTARMGLALNLVDLFIKDGCRGMGAGSALLNCFDTYAKERNVSSAFLLTFEEDAIEFYEKFDWKRESLQFLRKAY